MNQSVKKAFEILSFIVENPRKLSLNQMARSLNMNKTTLFRFVSTLESLDILARRDDYYIPGMKLFEWGNRVPVNQILVERIQPLLRRLTEKLNETVNLGQFSSNQVLYLAKTEGTRSLRIHTSIGSYTAINSTALGKSILSILPDPQRETVLKNITYERKTKHTITTPDELNKQALQVRQDGYSTDLEELEEGLHCVAVPLFIESLKFYGGLSCSGTTDRFTPERMAQYAGKLQEAVIDIQNTFSTGERQ